MKVRNYVYTFFVDCDSPLFRLWTNQEREDLTSVIQRVLEFYAGDGYVVSGMSEEEAEIDDDMCDEMVEDDD